MNILTFLTSSSGEIVPPEKLNLGFFENLWKKIVDFFSNYGIDIVIRTALALLLVLAGHYLIKVLIMWLRKILGHKNKKTGKCIEASVQSFISSVVKFILNIILAICTLAVINIPLSGFASIISAAVLAIGLSLQDIMANFANGVIILSAKSIKAGDYISVNGVEGTVKQINMMTIELDTPDNKVIVIPNTTVVKNTMTNYSTKPTRRETISVGVSYNTDIEKARKVIIDEILIKDKRILQNKPMAVVVTGFGDSEISLSVRCWVKNSDYWDVLFAINEKLITVLAKNNIEIPYNKLDVNIKNYDKKD